MYKIFEYVHSHFQPIVKQIPWYLKDTTGFLSKLDAITSVPDNVYAVSLDVKSLYTSMPDAEGIKAVKVSFDNSTSENVATKVIKFFGSYFNLKQLCVQLQTLFSNKMMCHGYDMRTIVCKYFHGSL